MIHTRRLGAVDGVPTVLAHCFLGHSGGWKGLVDALDPSVDAVAMDMPGHGRSPMPEVAGDFHAMVSDLIGALAIRPSLLIGHSFGAASMLRHAVHHPDTATGLVLIEPVLFCAAEGEAEFAPYKASELALHAAVEAQDLRAAAKHFLALNPGSPIFEDLPPQAQALMATQMQLVTATRAGLFDDSGGLLAPGLLEGFDVPVLLMIGSATTPIFRAVVRRLAARLPRVETVVIEGAGHMVPISHPHETARALNDWMHRTGHVATTTA